MDKTGDKLKQILDIGIALSAEKNPDKLLNNIVDTAMELTGSDGGTLYVINNDELFFRIMKTKSKGIDYGKDGEKISIPPVPLNEKHICAYAAINKQPLNIDDVYESDLFDFSGPKKYDSMNDYHTKSMVAIPMIDARDEVIGVMQLINAMDEAGDIRAYSEEEERILLALSSLTAIALSNMAYLDELTLQMWSFTEALTEAIDARTPYNGSHTRKVAEYSGIIVDKLNSLYECGQGQVFFDEEHKAQIVMAALLHDIGKMIVPIEVMNKSTRLENRLDAIKNRLQIISLKMEVDYCKNQLSQEDYKSGIDRINFAKEIVEKVNGAGYIDDETLSQVDIVCGYSYESPDKSEIIPFFTDEEALCLHIRKGTLSDEERKIMESHVEMTGRILSKVHFNKSFANAPIWAARHHEYLDGTGYPDGIKADELGIEERILTAADICDALLATDRPYKKPMPLNKAVEIMRAMADEGKLDGQIVDILGTTLGER